MDQFFREPVIYGACQLLLPLIPSCVLFYALPSTGNVHGVLKGLHFKLGGAFAGYFVLYVLMLETWPAIPAIQPSVEYEPWLVTGNLQVRNLDGSSPSPQYEAMAVQLSQQRPPLGSVNDNGDFLFYIFTEPARAGAKQHFPSVEARIAGYSPATVSLDSPNRLGNPYTIHFDGKHHEIDIEGSLLLQQLPPRSEAANNGHSP